MAPTPSEPAADPRERLVLRYAEPSDSSRLVALAGAIAGEPEGWLLADAAWRSAAEERRYVRAVQRHPDAALLVAELDGELIGRLSITRDPHPSSPHVADLGLMVAQPWRRHGIATALMLAAEAWAARAGVTKLELHVFPYNTPARALYERLGYEHEGLRRRHYRRPDGRYVDAILLAKHLVPLDAEQDDPTGELRTDG